mgnify:CR=1 FL=1|jgi:hypothetical protein
MFTIGISFLGQYRPAYFQADTLGDAIAAAVRAVYHMDNADFDWIMERLRIGGDEMAIKRISAWSAEHGRRAVSFRRGAHDPFLDSVTRHMMPAPGVDYSEAANR